LKHDEHDENVPIASHIAYMYLLRR
jgi:hypothetical protein